MRQHLATLRFAFAASLAWCTAQAAETLWLDAMDLSHMRQGYGQPQVNRSMREKPLAVAGQDFNRGVGTHANSTYWLNLAGGTERFVAKVGVDDAAGGGTIEFRVIGDGKTLFDSGIMKPGQAAKPIDLDLRGVNTLLLQVKDGGDGIGFDHADWAEAHFVVAGVKPAPIPVPKEEKVFLTPRPAPAPKINGPVVSGGRPGNPFIFRIPTTGTRPIQFSARNLPAGLHLDAARGILTGTLTKRGEYLVTLKARNAFGSATRKLKIVCGDRLALTPPMGWNHWYTHYDRITDTLMREAADVMEATGMADVGYQYVSIDDCWMNAPKQNDPLRVGPLRDAQGNILPNRHFPDMRGMTDYIHSKGLKAGIYTSPGPFTCAGFSGTYQHEAQDAKQFADWGFDFLKYDWCSYGNIAKDDKSLAAYQKPYRLMGDLLKQQKRDIVFNLCQYGMGDVWEWGEEVGGHCWRTAGDLGFELDRIFEVALKNAEHRQWSHPGSWNDPDYIQIGYIGGASSMGEPTPCPLTPNEQYSFMSLWCLSAAPLFFSGHMGKLDEFTLNILCNAELIEVDQDPLGQGGSVVPLTPETFAMVKEMADGSKAIGLFNRGEMGAVVSASWSQLGLTGRQRVRDLWRQIDLGVATDKLEAKLGRHAGHVVRVWPTRRQH